MSVEPNFDPSEIVFESLRAELLIRTLIKDVRTAIPVKVMAVHPGTGSPPSIGTVDVQPLVQTVDGSGKLWSLAEVYGATFGRIQSGNTAFILDPSVGDIGLAIACDRDISTVLASMALAGPGSSRTHDISDLVYVMSIRSAKPVTQYIEGNSSGLTLYSPNTITLQGSQINLIGPVSQTEGTMTVQTQLTVPILDATTDVNVPLGSVNSHVHEVISVGSPTGPMTG